MSSTKRSAFDERKDQSVANDFLSAHLACSFCGAMTDRVELATYGARCYRCYSAYLREGSTGQNARPMLVPERREMLQRLRVTCAGQRKPAGKDWAWALRKREQAGEKLGQYARDAWRYALRHELQQEQA